MKLKNNPTLALKQAAQSGAKSETLPLKVKAPRRFKFGIAYIFYIYQEFWVILSQFLVHEERQYH